MTAAWQDKFNFVGDGFPVEASLLAKGAEHSQSM